MFGPVKINAAASAASTNVIRPWISASARITQKAIHPERRALERMGILGQHTLWSFQAIWGTALSLSRAEGDQVFIAVEVPARGTVYADYLTGLGGPDRDLHFHRFHDGDHIS
jgi:hypothetical protein